MTEKHDMDFLKYFIRSYIPPYTKRAPNRKEEYEEIYLSADNIWVGLYKIIDRIPFPIDIKKNMIELFALSDEIWRIYLLTKHSVSYSAFMMKNEIRDKWKKIESLARNIEYYYENEPQFKSTIIICK